MLCYVVMLKIALSCIHFCFIAFNESKFVNQSLIVGAKRECWPQKSRLIFWYLEAKNWQLIKGACIFHMIRLNVKFLGLFILSSSVLNKCMYKEMANWVFIKCLLNVLANVLWFKTQKCLLNNKVYIIITTGNIYIHSILLYTLR